MRFLPVAAALLWPLCSFADVTLASLFGDHMVLQRDQPVAVWGTASPGETVNVTYRTSTATATAGSDGRWRAQLPALALGAPAELIVQGHNTLRLADVVVGDVWICGGQSNMQWEVKGSLNAAAEIAAANFPGIRVLRVAPTPADAPANDFAKAKWNPATPETAGAFTGVGYFFARELHARTQVPIGLINTSVGGTPVESWMSREAINLPLFAPVIERWAGLAAAFPAKKVKYDADFAAWQKASADARAKNQPEPKRPLLPVGGPGSRVAPAVLFNGMIAPILPVAFRGVIWFQGEGNAVRWESYEAMFRTMIRQWRHDFGRGDFPFYFVQLANFNAPAPERQNYAWLRAAQAVALKEKNTGMAVAIDVGDPRDIHFPNKQAVGHRLALIALAQSYGQPGEFSGPVLTGHKRAGRTLRLQFSHAEGLALRAGNGGVAFQIAGEDRVFHPATAKLDGAAVVISSDQVSKPVAARYAWVNTPDAVLYNAAGLPAAPFRTDSWPAYSSK